MPARFPDIFAGGERRMLNLLQSPASMMQAAGPAFTTSLPPVSEIKPQGRRPTWLPIRNQGQYGACVGHMGARGVELSRALGGMDGPAGRDFLPLSPWDVYARLCNGIDQGASIGQCLQLLAREGVALDGMVPQGCIDPRMIGPDAASDRIRFRIEIGGLLHSFEEMAWASANGHSVGFSVHVPPNTHWDVNPATGRPPAVRGAGNHAVVTNGDITRGRDGALELGVDNSWSTAWGTHGTFKCTDRLIQCQSYFEGWRLVAVVYDHEASEMPPVSPVA